MLKYQPPADTAVVADAATANNDNDRFSKYESIENMIFEMKTPREDVNADKKPVAKTEAETEVIEDAPELKEPVNTPSTDIPAIDADKPKIPSKLARLEARFMARTFDSITSMSCSYISDENPDDFSADDDELNDITEYLYEWRSESTVPLPLWIKLVVGIGFIYAPKFKLAFKIRNIKKRSLALENERNEMKQTIKHQIEKIQHQEQETNAA